jgi:S-disulfanyl-L-cysteine oxidoreductase SoxD
MGLRIRARPLLRATTVGVVLCPIAASLSAPELTIRDGVYSQQQATRGQAVYAAKCSLCHGPALQGGANESPPLRGKRFLADWDQMPLRALYSRILSTMPKADPGSLTTEETLSLVAYVLQQNGFPTSSARSLTSADVLSSIRFVAPAE